MTDPEDLDSLRRRIRELDDRLVSLAAERQALVRQVGEEKRRRGLPTVDFAQERQVLERVRSLAADRRLDPRLAEDLMLRLIRASVTAQEEDSLRQAATGAGEQAVVVGGAGRMGRWIRRFLEAQGFSVAVLDPKMPQERERAEALLPGAKLVLYATPPGQTARLYHELCPSPPAGVVADLASIKTPLLSPIRELQRAGGRVASLHPMFGPSILVLRDADVLICDTGDAEATAAVEALFAPTTARRVHLPLVDHDRLMADLLSLAHATAFAFALALPDANHPVRSTTFRALEGLASAIVRESPDLYYEIQADNPHSLSAVERLRAAVEQLLTVVRARSVEDFRALLAEGRRRTGRGDSAAPAAVDGGTEERSAGSK